jgi:hypothetical protein
MEILNDIMLVNEVRWKLGYIFIGIIKIKHNFLYWCLKAQKPKLFDNSA